MHTGLSWEVCGLLKVDLFTYFAGGTALSHLNQFAGHSFMDTNC